MRTEAQRQYQRDRYALLRSHGLCIRCKADSPDLYLCPKCTERVRKQREGKQPSAETKRKAKIRLRNRYLAFVRSNICPRCRGENYNGKSTCDGCLRKMKLYTLSRYNNILKREPFKQLSPDTPRLNQDVAKRKGAQLKDSENAGTD